jgi:[NiFe] hydrogenase assembly HybE family chaperone
MAEPEVARAPDPSPRLTRAFELIASERMAGVPILNTRLSVEAVGFREWNGHWLGALVTPWFINLVVMPLDPAAWRSAPERENVPYPFPTGVFNFIAACEPGLGEYHACSLFSPVLEFADQAAARATARVALEGLFDPAVLGEAPRSAADAAEHRQTMSRREFLRGASSAPQS